ncbi:MAG TPA: right-handed parallel beta-helix repeat-containing protein [Anaerolineaceae bacterium]|nr:right-handed parallel beta-helix repeat-containing protein [Anaerolineaceae bacterium]
MTNTVIVPYGVTLTIEAGVTVDSAAGAWSNFLVIRGHLDINGTADHPVVLTHTPNYPNQNWSGIFFDGSQGDGSGSIQYATITHAGSNFDPPDCPGCGGQIAVFVHNLASTNQVTIDHSNITDNTSRGLLVDNSKVNVSDTTFSLNKYPIWIKGPLSEIVYSGNTFINNAYPYYDNTNYFVQEDAIFMGTGALTDQDFNLPSQTGLDAYVLLENFTIPADVRMTVEPGVTLRMENDNYLTVLGFLNAVGTPTLPIHFSSIPSSDPNIKLNWGGLYFDGNAGNGGGLISHAIVEQGGSNFLPPACSGTCGSAQTAVFIKDLPTNKSLEFNNSIIQGSLNRGLFVVNSQSAQLDRNLIKGGKIGAHFVSNMTISNLALIDQANDGVIVENGYTLDARHLTISGAGQSGLHVLSGGTGLLRNSILSHNALAAWAEGSGSISMDTNLSDANTAFQVGTVTATNTIEGPAEFKADGYHIQDNSSAVSEGLRGLSGVDIDGDARAWPAATKPDLGVDEISAGFLRVYIPFIVR